MCQEKKDLSLWKSMDCWMNRWLDEWTVALKEVGCAAKFVIYRFMAPVPLIGRSNRLRQLRRVRLECWSIGILSKEAEQFRDDIFRLDYC